MSQEPETIGPLTFVPNPDYPYPFEVETPPRFWMEEESGLLAEAIEVCMRSEPVSKEQMALIKIYLTQYLQRALMSGEGNRRMLLSKVERLRKTSDVERLIDELAEVGVEPF